MIHTTSLDAVRPRRLIRRPHCGARRLAALFLGTTLALSVATLAAPAAHAAESEPVGTAGLLYVGRVHAQAAPSLLPSGGNASLTLEVRNLSTHAVSGSVDFWISTPWGARVSTLPTAQVEDLAPGETRTLTARLDGPGQWAFTTAHAVFTPPAKIDKLAARPQARQEFLLVPPYFAIATLAVLILAGVAIRGALRRRRPVDTLSAAELEESWATPSAVIV